MAVFEGITDKTSAYTYTLVNTTTGLTAALSTNVLTVSGLTPDSGSTDIRATSGSVTLEKTYSIGKSKAGPQGADNQDFSFLDANLSAVQGTLAAGLLMNSDVFGYHGAIGNGVTAALSDFTSFLDKDGNFYLGGNSSGATDSTGGYFAWNNSAKSLLISGSKAQVEVDKFFLGNVGTQFISGSDGNIRISGDVEFEGRNSNGATVYYDNFASYTNGAAVIPANSPQVDGSGVGYYKSGAGEVVTVNTPSNVGGYSGKVLRLGNSSGNDYVYLTGNKLIPFNENSLYEIEFRYKHEAGSGTVYAGIVGFASDGTTYVNVTGANSLSSQHYIATSAQGSSVNGNDWIIRKGYFKGHASTGTVGGQHNSDTDPAVLHSNVVNGYITPMFLANYNGVAGKVLLDYIKITEIGGGGSTKISGDSITTGTIKSNNLSTTVGTSLGLNDGIMKIGGTNAYTSTNGILLDGPNAKFAVGIASGNYMRFNHTAGKLEINTPNFTIDNSGNVAVSGNITVSNPSDFADANAENPIVYDFGGNGSQTIQDNAVWRKTWNNAGAWTGGSGQAVGYTATTTGAKLNAYYSSGYGTYDFGIVSVNSQQRANNPVLEWDMKINSVGTYNGMQVGLWNDATNLNNSAVPNLAYGIEINSDDIIVRAHDNTTSAGTFSSAIVVGDLIRLRIRVKSEGGAELSIFKNGDFTSPAHTYSYGTVGTETTLHIGTAVNTYYGQSSQAVEHQKVAFGTPLGPTTIISGNGISTGILESSNLTGTAGSQFNLNDGKFKLGGTTSPKLEWDGATLSVKGQITVEGGYNSSAGELFGNPTGKLLKSDGRPGGWSAGYSNNSADTIKSTDLSDGNGAIVELSSTTDAEIGMVSHAFPIEVQQNYKINLVLKADLADSNGLYIRIYEYDSELPAGKDSISNNSDGSSTSVSNVQEDTRQNSVTWTNDAGSAVTTENGPITTSYVSYNGTYTPTATAKYFSVVILNWGGMAPTATKLFLKSMNVRKVSQGTTITGAGISTGLIQSVNLNADSGSKINLDDGSMIMGGTSSPGFEVTAEGFVTATNLTEKFVIVNSSNQSQYFQNYDISGGSTNDATRLILDGSLGGSVTMNLTIEEAPDFQISDIKFPANVGSDAISDMELKIATDDPVTFNTSTSTGFYSGLKSLGAQLLSVALARSS